MLGKKAADCTERPLSEKSGIRVKERLGKGCTAGCSLGVLNIRNLGKKIEDGSLWGGGGGFLLLLGERNKSWRLIAGIEGSTARKQRKKSGQRGLRHLLCLVKLCL